MNRSSTMAVVVAFNGWSGQQHDRLPGPGMVLKLPMHSRGEGVHRAAVGIVGGIADKLIVQAEPRRGGQRIAVIGLEDLLQARIGQLPVADQNADAAGIQKRDVLARYAV